MSTFSSAQAAEATVGQDVARVVVLPPALADRFANVSSEGAVAVAGGGAEVAAIVRAHAVLAGVGALLDANVIARAVEADLAAIRVSLAELVVQAKAIAASQATIAAGVKLK